MAIVRRVATLLCSALLGGCLTVGPQTPERRQGDHLVQLLLKTDANKMVELSLLASRAQLRALAQQLYQHNPSRVQRPGALGMEASIRLLFDSEHDWRLPGLQGRRGGAAIKLALDPEYAGDRVFAFVAGLLYMVDVSYGGKSEFYFYESPNAQLLYNSARNLELAAWQLRSTVDADGAPLLRSGESGNPGLALQFGKLIATQDNLSRFITAQGGRLVRRVLGPLSSAVFLPM